MKASDIKKVACIGSGLIGSSWATNFCMKGYAVNLYDINDAALKSAKIRINDNLDFLVECAILSKEEVAEAKKLVRYTTNIEEAVKDVQFIQENGPEHYDIKQNILEEIDKFANKDTIYASSTSGLLISEIAKYSSNAGRCIGAHPYNPPHLIPLVEMSKGENTTEEVLNTAYDFYKLLGKEPVILQKEVLGFISNRLQMALYREIIEIVNRGVCTIEDIDKACLYGPGLRYGILGPNLIWQLGGGDVGLSGLMRHVQESMELWMDDMADWKRIPEDWFDKSQKGIEEAMKNRPKEFGNTNEEIVRFRDDMLLKLLKMHKKI